MREDMDDAESVIVSSSEIGATDSTTSMTTAFRNSMRNLAATVSVVTMGTGSEASGFTATSVVSLSMDPPTVLVCVNRKSSSWPLLSSTGRFAINILSSTHREIAETFAGRRGLAGHDRYIDPRWRKSNDRIPCLADALSVVECDLEEAIERHSHAILIGRVLNVTAGTAVRPLVYWQGDYNHFCSP